MDDTRVCFYKIPVTPFHYREANEMSGLRNQKLSEILEDEIGYRRNICSLKLKEIKDLFTAKVLLKSRIATHIYGLNVFFPTLYLKYFQDEQGIWYTRARKLNVYIPCLLGTLSVATLCSILGYAFDPEVGLSVSITTLWAALTSADYLSNFFENKQIEYFQTLFLTEQEAVITKIERTINELEHFPKKPINIKYLSKDFLSLKLSINAKSKILSECNFKQIMKLRSDLGNQFFIEFHNPESEHSEKMTLIRLLDSLPLLKTSEAYAKILALNESFLKDPTLWAEIVKALSEEQLVDLQITDYLSEIGRQIIKGESSVDQVINQLRNKTRQEVIIEVEGGHNPLYIDKNELLEYPYFRDLPSNSMKISTQNSSSEPNPEVITALKYLVQYIQNKQVELPVNIIPTLSQLAKQLNIHDCLADCEEFISKRTHY